MKRRRLVHFLRVAFVRASLRTTRCFSLRSLQACSRLLAPLARLASARVRTSLHANLALCFPQLDEGARHRLGRRALEHGIASALELGPLWCWEKERVLQLVRRVDGLERLALARAGGRGVLLVGPHLGAWEVVGLFLSANMPMTMLYRAPRLSELEPILRQARERHGAQLVPADSSGVRAVYRALRRGEVVGVLPDQDPGRGAGVLAPFFGVPANTTPLIARLLAGTTALPFLVWAERLDHGLGYHLHIDELSASELGSPNLPRAASALNQALEQAVRRRPEQYLWSYRRFRNLPDGTSPYR